jgi:hypothetical protein
LTLGVAFLRTFPSPALPVHALRPGATGDAMNAAAMRARAKRSRHLVDAIIRESLLASGRAIGLTRQEILE